MCSSDLFGIEILYSNDGLKLLGTGGALRKALPLLGENFFVTYGDSFLLVDYAAVETAFKYSKKPALIHFILKHKNLQ